MDIEDEVVCVGDLHKKNLTGFKSWNLRRFALIGNNMVYYKNGLKRGEWDIAGCTVRAMTADECNQSAAKYAFGIEGPKKQYLFSASSSKNRDIWINMISKQIEEFKNPIRKFLKRGEVVIGSGIVKRKNMFGKVPTNLIVTNFPRILVTDPSTSLLKDQLNWTRGQSSFTKLDNSKFKITINQKDITYEDPVEGMSYWERTFNTLGVTQLYTSKRNELVKIGLGNELSEKEHQKETSKTDQNLQFLEEGSSSINQLLITLNSKIDQLEKILAEEFKNQHNWSKDQHNWFNGDDDARQLYQDKLIKRTQLQMLKENIELIAENLDKLTVNVKKSPLSVSFDRVAIRNVIEEAGTLWSLLNSDDEDEDDDDKDLQFGDEVHNIDAAIAQLEEENIATEEMIANVEFLSLFSDDSLSKLNEKFDSLVVDAALDMKIDNNNFNPDDISTRPMLWREIRTKRLLIKEYVLKLEGTMEDAIVENRKNAVAAEEVQMVQEVSTYGRLLNLAALAVKGGIEKAAMHVTLDNFDPHSPDLRPLAWRPIRLRRVMVKEDFSSGNGGPPVSESELARSRPRRVMEEEKTMTMEVIQHGQILSFGNPSENPTRTQTFLDSESAGSEVVRERASTIRDRANTMRDRAFTIRDKETIGGGRTRVASSVPVYRGRAPSTAAPVVNCDVSPDSFDPDNENIRPEGWVEERMKRVLAKEQSDRLEGADEETIILNRKKKLQREEEVMINEVLSQGNVVGFTKPIKVINSSDYANKSGTSVDESKSSADGTNDEFTSLLMRRVLALEQADREKGVDEDTIASQRQTREKSESALMKDELKRHGKILGAKEQQGRKRAATTLQDVNMLEIDEENFEISNPLKRPQQWGEVKLKRVMLKEHIDRIAGAVEQSIMELRPLRDLEEELSMTAEVVCFGRLLGVGETSRPSDQIATTLDITEKTFNAANPLKRPPGWTEIRQQRVALKDLEDRLNKVPDETIASKKAARESDVEKAMVREAMTGQVSLIGTRKQSAAGGNATVKSITKGVASAYLSNVKANASKEVSPRMPQEIEEYERRRQQLKRVQDLEVKASDFDPAHPDAKPKNWAEIKLRKVYLKEWQDRKDGLDEDEILAKRYEREMQVEEEMEQAMTVFGRIRMFENRIQGAAKNVNQKVKIGSKDVVSRATNKSGGLSNQISVSSQNIELSLKKLNQISAAHDTKNLPKPPPVNNTKR